MGYSFGKTLLKTLKNLGVIGVLAGLAAMTSSVGDVAIELGSLGPVIALGLQLGFSALIDWIQHRT